MILQDNKNETENWICAVLHDFSYRFLVEKQTRELIGEGYMRIQCWWSFAELNISNETL